MSRDKNPILYLDQPNPTANWSEAVRNAEALPIDVERFKANLVMLDTPALEIEEAIDTIQQDLRRWSGIGSPYFTSPAQIDGFHAYLVECDSDLDLAHTCADTRRRLAGKIRVRRKWAHLADPDCQEGHFSEAFKHYDPGLAALWPKPGSPGFRDFIEDSSLAFRHQLAQGAVPLGRDGISIRAYESDMRDYINAHSLTEVEDSLSLLKTKLVLACGPEASIYNVEVEAVYHSLNCGDSAASLKLLAYYSDLWWSLARPRLKSWDDVEAFIALGLVRRWYGPARSDEPVPDSIQRDSRTVRGFCEALMLRAIRPITDFARALAAYHPLLEEEDYYADARGYYDYLRSASARFSGNVPGGDIEF